MKKILFITAHRKDRAPNQRFRFEQYLAYLSQNGFECTFSPLIASSGEDKLFYSPRNYLKKIPLGLTFGLRRLKDLLRADEFDVIFIAREAFFMGTTFFERQFAKSKAKIVFDFDDSIWMNVISSNNRIFSWLKDGSKTRRIVQLADVVFAGNQYLADYARNFNKNVVIIPTTIDTNLYQPKYDIKKDKIIIGWSGSVSTIEHFQFAIPALEAIKKTFGSRIEIKVIGDARYRNEALKIVGLPWQMDTELHDLQCFDIGIMPLPNDEWTKGKCGLKGIQYMALEIPTIMSPVGVNTTIIQDGVNGYLAEAQEEWVKKLTLLIENPNLRIELGKRGRETVVNYYSVESQKNRYLNFFQFLTKD